MEKLVLFLEKKTKLKQVSAGQECGITLKDFNDYQKKDIIEVFNSTSYRKNNMNENRIRKTSFSKTA